MTRFNGKSIEALFEKSKLQAKRNLKKLDVCCGEEPDFAGLNGWVFEKTILSCLLEELVVKGIVRKIEEQVSLGGRARADLKIGSVAIEIKVSGLFSFDDIQKYGKYRKAAEKQGLQYLFLSREESYAPYRKGIIKTLGKANVFYLSDKSEWSRFVARLIEGIKKVGS